MSKFWIIATDVYKKNVKSLSFLIMILAPFLLVGIVYLAGSLASGFSGDTTIGLVSENQALVKELTKNKTEEFSFKAVSSEKKAQEQLKDEKIDAYLLLDTTDNQISGQLYSERSLGNATEMLIPQMLNQLQTMANANRLNLTAEQVAMLNQQATFKKAKISFDENGKIKTGEDNTGIQMALAMGITILLFVFISSYSSIIAQEIASEKGTRIMEVILSSTKAQTHFYGKLTGVILVALTQIFIYGVAFVLGYSQLKNLDFMKSLLSGISPQSIFSSTFIFTLGFFIIGILVFAVLAALCGSLVSKPEDTAKAVQPIMYIGLIGYMIGITFGTNDPQNIVVKVTSFIPLISSYIMPVRLATETASTMEAIVSLVILAVFGIILTIFSARLYKSNVLVYSEGGMIQSLKQSISILKNEQKHK
ncbi:ABC transporter permease [Enterococcus faecalis]|uniref:ABC transporter permease n=1 Tax=Enterococcus faecalis TaxID=1351 RepID=UPI000CF0B5B8|nr:ABC transporter permease [Enterococcus faecalis]EGO6112543.1 ABC transporter permease [Enterococcus faecalis]EJJ1465205.1 ABC transporter permease [Enterococcus faecalis]EME5461940.1 ABC transporter permease [Enterococcus faecalis]PQC42040.1 sodium ABC transporter permease [Enterococcus faecalis]PQF96261.1 sodium ABC transporter permease [Enterococcus faecalis]